MNVKPLAGESWGVVLARPGQELWVHGWLENHRPHVSLLTDGSPSGLGSLQSTVVLLDHVGATRGLMFGRIPESGLARVVNHADASRLMHLAEELAETWLENGVRHLLVPTVEADDLTGIVTRLLVDTAVTRLNVARPGTRLLEFSQGRQPTAPRLYDSFASETILDGETWPRKLAAMLAYQPLPELIQTLMDRQEIGIMRREHLSQARPMQLEKQPLFLPILTEMRRYAAGGVIAA